MNATAVMHNCQSHTKNTSIIVYFMSMYMFINTCTIHLHAHVYMHVCTYLHISHKLNEPVKHYITLKQYTDLLHTCTPFFYEKLVTALSASTLPVTCKSLSLDYSVFGGLVNPVGSFILS